MGSLRISSPQATKKRAYWCQYTGTPFFVCPKQFSEWNLGTNFTPLTLDEMKAQEPEVFDRVAGGDGEGKNNLTSGAESGILSIMSSQIENKYTSVGVPSDIYRHGRPLDNRQQALLERLPEYNSRVVVGKDDVSMNDLSALTAKTGDEFAMFTRGAERLVVRGNDERVDINTMSAAELSAQGYKWSGHTHPGGSDIDLLSSDGDKAVLRAFNQDISVIYNSIGDYQTFDKKGRRD
ncbi:MAG: hypothetical protein LBB74_09255 [Chitinispirillales bacterium]|jgi:hypothetical protein|nr:hypothetical protein [Chitinispirillales bacterium]